MQTSPKEVTKQTVSNSFNNRRCICCLIVWRIVGSKYKIFINKNNKLFLKKSSQSFLVVEQCLWKFQFLNLSQCKMRLVIKAVRISWRCSPPCTHLVLSVMRRKCRYSKTYVRNSWQSTLVDFSRPHACNTYGVVRNGSAIQIYIRNRNDACTM